MEIDYIDYAIICILYSANEGCSQARCHRIRIGDGDSRIGVIMKSTVNLGLLLRVFALVVPRFDQRSVIRLTSYARIIVLAGRDKCFVKVLHSFTSRDLVQLPQIIAMGATSKNEDGSKSERRCELHGGFATAPRCEIVAF